MLQGMLGRLLAIFNPDLPRKVWLFQLGVLINFLGNGMVAPFLIIYLHFGRGIPLAVAGSAVALGGITAVTSGLLAGSQPSSVSDWAEPSGESWPRAGSKATCSCWCSMRSRS